MVVIGKEGFTGLMVVIVGFVSGRWMIDAWVGGGYSVDNISLSLSLLVFSDNGKYITGLYGGAHCSFMFH